MITEITLSGGGVTEIIVGGGGMSAAYSNEAYPGLKTYKDAVDYMLGTKHYVLRSLSDPVILEDSMYLTD
jgi:hypothetical protein